MAVEVATSAQLLGWRSQGS